MCVCVCDDGCQVPTLLTFPGAGWCPLAGVEGTWPDRKARTLRGGGMPQEGVWRSVEVVDVLFVGKLVLSSLGRKSGKLYVCLCEWMNDRSHA